MFHCQTVTLSTGSSSSSGSGSFLEYVERERLTESRQRRWTYFVETFARPSFDLLFYLTLNVILFVA